MPFRVTPLPDSYVRLSFPRRGAPDFEIDLSPPRVLAACNAIHQACRDALDNPRAEYLLGRRWRCSVDVAIGCPGDEDVVMLRASPEVWLEATRAMLEAIKEVGIAGHA